MAKKSGGTAVRGATHKKTPVKPIAPEAPSPQPSVSSDPEPPESSFPIVGIGASAGGLEAVTQLLEHLPATTGMAFVLIQHLDPTHASELSEILSRKSTMPVREVNGEITVEPDHVYVIPANGNLKIEKGALITVPRLTEGGARTLPIDEFFESLAKDRGNQAFGVVLSGTASDGTLGLQAIKGEGGITFAQEPGTAKFDGMPRSAIAAGAVDFVLSPEAIAKQLAALAHHSYLYHSADESAEETAARGGDLSVILNVLRSATGIDFTYYKHNTILRRIERRMALHDMDSLKEYGRVLRQDPAEAKSLAQDFLINVTAFFREPENYKVLHDTVFPALTEGRSPDDPIRIWIPGCSTGEEAYSLAISLTEFLDKHQIACGMQIFATDLSEAVIDRARTGVYPENALAGVSRERRQRFFTKIDRVYQISQAIRSACVFARQDLTSDPPFSRMDLISCCNLLIYLGPPLQKKAIALFHYALKPGGFLVLGTSESIGAFSDAFEVVDRKQRIFTKKRDELRLVPMVAREELSAAVSSSPGLLADAGSALKNIQRHVERILLAEYAPAGVIVDATMHVLHVRGDTSFYLQLPPGEPTTDLTRLVKPGLLAPLKTAIRKARLQNTQVRESGIRLRDAGAVRNLDLRVVPLREPTGKEQCFLVLFDAPDQHAGRTAAADKRNKGKAARADRDEVQRLSEELRRTREYLQSIIESQEAATEELRSANEEAQATNEELDTAKEELQASNEELNTVNDELRARNLEQSTLNSDLRKLLESINVPLVMVDKNLHIRWFTAPMESLLNLLPTDQGRPITDLRSVAIPNFRELLVAALAGQQNQNIEIASPRGRWLSLRILPFRGPDNQIDGAIATLIDIDELKKARDFAEAVVGVVREPVVVLDASLRVRTANQAFYQTFQVEPKATEGRPIYEIGGGEWNIPKLRHLLEEILPQSSWTKDFEVEQKSKGTGLRTMMLHAREMRQGDERVILLAIDDITELRQSSADLRKTNEDLKQFIYAASHDLQEPIRTIVTYTDLLSRRFADKLGTEGGTFINYAVEAALRLEALIAGLREFWQLSEKVEAQRSAVDCDDVLRTVLRNLEKPIAETGAQITAEDLPSVMASETPLIQLFQNLIGNALKYRSSEPPRIHVSAARGPSEWTFSIADNGLGIDPKYSTEVFRVFKRLHSRGKFPGTGIGLAICEKIVERYGGRIWVEPNKPQGSIFKFTMPY